MFLTRLAEAVTSVGTACAFLVFVAGGRPVAPLAPDAVLGPALAGVAGAYLLCGVVATAEVRTGSGLAGRGTVAVTLGALALAAFLNAMHPVVAAGFDGRAVGVENVGLALGAAALCYPVAGAFALGAAPEWRTATLGVVGAVGVVGFALVLAFRPAGGLSVGSALGGLGATLVVDVAAGYPLYRLGRAVAAHRESPFTERSVPPGVGHGK